MSLNMERAKRLRDEGLPWHEVATRLKTTIPHLRRQWAGAGLPSDRRYNLKNRRRVITAEKLIKATALRDTGLTWKEVGKALRTNYLTLQSAVYRSRMLENPPEVVVKASEMREQGLTWKAIARALDVEMKTIRDKVRNFRPVRL